jgi:hypothetical protein
VYFGAKLRINYYFRNAKLRQNGRKKCQVADKILLDIINVWAKKSSIIRKIDDRAMK